MTYYTGETVINLTETITKLSMKIIEAEQDYIKRIEELRTANREQLEELMDLRREVERLKGDKENGKRN